MTRIIIQNLSKRTVLFFFIILSRFQLLAQWSQSVNSGHSGSVYCFASDNGALFAGTPYGVFKHAPNTSTWSQFSSGLSMDIDGGQINCLLIDGASILTGTLYGIYKSPIDKDAWQWVSNGFPPLTGVTSIIKVGTNLFAATEGYGVYKSTDDALSWQAVNNGLPSSPFLFVSSIYAVGTDLYAGTQADGIYKSTDYGDSWVPVNNNLPVSNNQVNCFAVSGNKIYVGTYQGVFVTSNGGALWSTVSSGIPLYSNVNALLIDGSNLYACTFDNGIYLSVNDGASWNHSAFASTFELAEIGNTLFAGTGQGVFASYDGGNSWAQENIGLNNLLVNSLISQGDSLIVGTDSGGVLLSDSDLTWTEISPSPRWLTSVISAGKDNFFYTTGLDIIRLYFANNSWTESNSVQESYSLYKFGNSLFAGANQAIYVSTDQGLTWSASDVGMPSGYYIKCFASNGSILFAGTNIGVFMSFDSGQSWSPSNNGLPSSTVNTLFVHGDKLFAGTELSGIFVSNDKGQSWRLASNGFTQISNLRVNAFASYFSMLFVGANQGVYFSNDAGNSWKTLNDGLVNPYVQSLAVCRDKLYSGTANWIWSRSMSDLIIPQAANPSSITSSSFIAKWKRVNGATGYQVDVSSDGFSTYVTNYSSASATDTLMLVTGLNPSTPYQYRIRAIEGDLTSLNSNSIEAVTLPEAPLAVSASGLTSSSFIATWRRVNGATGYQVDVSLDGFSTYVTNYSSASVADTLLLVSGLSPVTTYQYRVRYVVDSFISKNSNIISTATPQVTGVVDQAGQSLFPNPSAQCIFISGIESDVVQTLVFDTVGKSVVTNPSIENDQLRYDIKELPCGLYILQLRTSDQVYQFRFIKN